jgi:3-hydroxyisobutyrate dehydrogenase-like beta-hydroxyacid dehydrogenase
MYWTPKRLKELKERGYKLRSSPSSLVKKSDQAISSLDTREVVDSVRPGPGQQHQASSAKLKEPQASSGKHQAPSSKRQA